MADLAIFDLDYTLTRKGTWGRFMMRSLADRPLQVPAFWIRAAFAQWQYKRGKTPRIAVKTEMLKRSIAAWPRARVDALADAFVADDLKTGLNDRVLAALQTHIDRGDKVLIASAAVDVLVERYADALAVDGQVSTAMAWTEDDHLAVGFASANCYGEEKLSRIKSWMVENAVQPDFITAYSDSRADAPMLEFADRAVVVSPNAKTRAYAQAMNFEIWE